jgi:tripartite-type tricarboxylate transporter receptor subunit TctC
LIGKALMVLTVHSSVAAHSVKEFADLARANGGQLSYGSIGVGSASHLPGKFVQAARRRRSAACALSRWAPAMNDFVAGHLNSMFLTAVVGLPHVQAGTLRALAIVASRRFELQPDVPTMAEADVPLEAVYWVDMAAAAATSHAVMARLERGLQHAVASPDIGKRLTEMGVVMTSLAAKDFGEFIRNDLAAWADFVAAAKLKTE